MRLVESLFVGPLATPLTLHLTLLAPSSIHQHCIAKRRPSLLAFLSLSRRGQKSGEHTRQLATVH